MGFAYIRIMLLRGEIMLKFILCDDNEQHNKYLSKAISLVLEKNGFEGEIACTATNSKDVIKYSFNNKGEDNVYVLDIDLPGDLNGINLAKKIRENDVLAYIIFVSAHQEYAMLCYKVKAFDFLLKPLNSKVLSECIDRLYNDYDKIIKTSNPKLPVKSGSKIHLLNIDDIIYIEKYGNVAVFHTVNGVLRSYVSLDELQKKTSLYGFYRCHNSYLINPKQIDYVSIKQNYVFMKNGKKVNVSRTYKKGLINIVKNTL